MRFTLLAFFFLMTGSIFCQGTGEVIITEYHNRPQKPTDEQLAAALPNNPAGADETPNEGHTEWFEVFNTTDEPVVMDGWTLTDASSSSNVTTIGSFTLAPNSYAVFSGFNIPEAQGGVEFDYFYDYKKPSFNNESSYADPGDTSCPDGVIIANAEGELVDEVRYDYGYGEYIGNMDAGSSCMNNEAAIGFPGQNGSSKVSFMLLVDPEVMNSADNDLPENWIYSSLVYDEENNQIGTPGNQNDQMVVSTDNVFLSDEVKLYPNPTSTMLNIQTYQMEVRGVEVYDLAGKRVNVSLLNSQSIDVSQLPSGLYSVRLKFEEGIAVKKFVVQR